LELRIYPSGSSRFTIYDGTDVLSEQGAASTTVTVASTTARSMLLRIFAPKPAAVRRDGAALSKAATSDAFDAATTAWWFDSVLGFVVVKFTLAGGTTRITL
jgi:hypothetical protein